MAWQYAISNGREAEVVRRHEGPSPKSLELDENFKTQLREAFKNYLADFFPLTVVGGYPPFPLSFFEHNGFPLRGGCFPQFR